VNTDENLTWAYDGGRLERARQVRPGAWECSLAGDSDAHGRNRSAIWFAFDVEGLGGLPVDLSVVGLENEWNLRPSLPWGPETRPVIAPGSGTSPASERAWRRLTTQEVTWAPAAGGGPGAGEPRLRLRFRVPEDPSGAATVAYIEPYSHADHLLFLRRTVTAAGVRARHRILGRSAEGRDVDLLTIGHERAASSSTPAIWLVFRQHPWETYSSYAAEGLVEWLLSGHDNTGNLTWHIVPMVNVDGCARGHTRHNAHGQDPNREWNEPQPAPEVACIRDAIHERLGGEPALFVDVHNNNQQTVDYLAVSNGFAGLPDSVAGERRERYGVLVERLAQALAAGSHFSGTVRGGARAAEAAATRGAPVGTAAATEAAATETVAAAARGRKPFSFPSMLLEMRTGPLPTRGGAYGTVADQRQLGAALAQSILTVLPER
jgi:hypothetical protein